MIKVERRYIGHSGPSTHETLIRIGQKLYRPTVVGFCWSEKAWSTAGLRMSKAEAVVLIAGKLYRMGERSCKPLELAEGEYFRPAGWHKGEAFVFDWQAAHGQAAN